MGGGGGGEVLRQLKTCGSSVGSQTQRRWSRRSAGAERPHAKPATDWLQPGSPRASLQLESDGYGALRVRKWVSEGEWGHHAGAWSAKCKCWRTVAVLLICGTNGKLP